MARPNSTAMSMMGMKLRIGPGFATPTRSASQPHWKIATMTPNDATTESRKPTRGLDRHEHRTEHHHQEQDREPDDDEAERDERVGEPVRDVDADRGRAGHRDRGARTRFSMAGARSRMFCTSALVSTASGALFGITWMMAVSSPASGSPWLT